LSIILSSMIMINATGYNYCLGHKCKFGTCQNGADKYTCNCFSGYNG